jgi:hypothetical protein
MKRSGFTAKNLFLTHSMICMHTSLFPTCDEKNSISFKGVVFLHTIPNGWVQAHFIYLLWVSATTFFVTFITGPIHPQYMSTLKEEDACSSETLVFTSVNLNSYHCKNFQHMQN